MTTDSADRSREAVDLIEENQRLRDVIGAIFAVADETLSEEFVRLRCVWCNELILANDRPGVLAAARTHDTTCGKNPSVIARQVAEQHLAEGRAYAACIGTRSEQPCGWAGRGVHVAGLLHRDLLAPVDQNPLNNGCPSCGGIVLLYAKEPPGVATMAQPAPAAVDGPDIWPLVMEDLRALRDVARAHPLTVKVIEGHGLGEAIDAAVEDMQARHVVGQQRYGRPLRAFNGRDALIEMYQELLDAVVYARQAEVEGLIDAAVSAQFKTALMGQLLAVRVLISRRAAAAAAKEG